MTISNTPIGSISHWGYVKLPRESDMKVIPCIPRSITGHVQDLYAKTQAEQLTIATPWGYIHA